MRAESESGGDPAARPRLSLLGYVLLGLSAAGMVAAGGASFGYRHARPTLVPQIVSGSPRLKKSSDGADVRWHRPGVVIYLDRSLAALAPGAGEAVQAAFGAWLESDSRLPNLAFDTTHGAKFGTAPNGKNEVSYGPITVQGHEHDLALTICFSDQVNGDVVETDVIFNSEHPFALLAAADSRHAHGSESDACHDQYDLQAVATHEAGHFFGLGEDFDVREATMYFSTARCELHKRALTDSDVTTMTGLYATSDDPPGAAKKGCSLSPLRPGATDGARLGFLALILFAAAGLRRARRYSYCTR